jgi:hypothetical protein
MNQKEEERLVMHLFREKLEAFPGGKLISSESPDFMLKLSPKKTIGIELTRLVHSNESLYANIQISVQKKNQKRNRYTQMNIQEYWLIIYTDDMRKMKTGHIENNLSKLNFDSEFDRVFMFDLFEGKIFRVD